MAPLFVNLIAFRMLAHTENIDQGRVPLRVSEEILSYLHKLI